MSKASILILGGGISGCAAAKLAEAAGFNATILKGEMASLPEGDFARAVVSPGIPLSHGVFDLLKARAIPFASELQFGCEALKSNGWKLLAVTGSKGKSSVVKFLADALACAGEVAVPCGNYGRAVSDVALLDRTGWAVVEVSSFMMETTSLPSDTFEAAAILNLQEDHLDRHGGVEVYHALKRKLLTFAKRGFSPCTAARADEHELFSRSYFDNGILSANAANAVRMLRAVGVADETIRAAFRSFVPLKHRMNVVLEADGVRFVDDSKATSIAALVAGVTMSGGNVRLIAGGRAKGDEPKNALPVLTKWVKKVYLIGESAEKLFSAWSQSVPCEVVGTLDRAVESARREAAKGETVLLSPGTASFDQFHSFEERGDVFADLVMKSKGKK